MRITATYYGDDMPKIPKQALACSVATVEAASGTLQRAKVGPKRPRTQQLPGPDALTCSVTATKALTGLGHTKISELIAKGTLKSVKVGRKRLVLMESIRALVQPGSELTSDAAPRRELHAA